MTPEQKKVYRARKRQFYQNMSPEEKKAYIDRSALSSRPYIKFKKDKCEHCGFIPMHSCQLDVDHINGDHEDNREENLQTLCANCHRLKSYLNKDYGGSSHE
jgi:5-methylcytosine-specific restriction endonuclease McrA